MAIARRQGVAKPPRPQERFLHRFLGVGRLTGDEAGGPVRSGVVVGEPCLQPCRVELRSRVHPGLPGRLHHMDAS